MQKNRGRKMRAIAGRCLTGVVMMAALSAGAAAQQKTLYVGMNGGDMERAFHAPCVPGVRAGQ